MSWRAALWVLLAPLALLSSACGPTSTSSQTGEANANGTIHPLEGPNQIATIEENNDFTLFYSPAIEPDGLQVAAKGNQTAELVSMPNDPNGSTVYHVTLTQPDGTSATVGRATVSSQNDKTVITYAGTLCPTITMTIDTQTPEQYTIDTNPCPNS